MLVHRYVELPESHLAHCSSGELAWSLGENKLDVAGKDFLD